MVGYALRAAVYGLRFAGCELWAGTEMEKEMKLLTDVMIETMTDV